ncbi:hypothetical protein [Alteromonas facilis]|uniref:hypothetical protein n=1 Tax=Alteromonas facilis TaxID=2048004 RepID=UPI000C2861EA|nr:hypothetical protein [Alteromonas facilis]
MSVASPISKVHYFIKPDMNLFLCRAEGEVTFDDLALHVDEILADPQYRAGMDGFYDFTQVSSITGQTDVWGKVAEDMSDERIIPDRSKTAFLVSDENELVKRVLEGYLMMTSASLVEYRLYGPSQIAELCTFIGSHTREAIVDFLSADF